MTNKITNQEVSKHIPIHEDTWIVSNTVVFLAIMVFCIMIIWAIITMYNRRESASNFILGIVVVFIIGAAVSFILFSVGFFKSFSEHETKLENKAEWENNYMIPYIESLPTEKSKAINKLNLKSERVETLTFTHDNEPVFVDTNPKGLSLFSDDSKPVTLISKEIKLLTDLKQGEEAYVSYKYLEEPLGWYQSGAYNITLHLPVDYQFK